MLRSFILSLYFVIKKSSKMFFLDPSLALIKGHNFFDHRRQLRFQKAEE